MYYNSRKDSEGHTCIHWAAKRGDYEILKYLHSAGAMLDIASTGDPRMLPIHWAASDGKIKSLKCVLHVLLHIISSPNECPFWDVLKDFSWIRELT